MNAKSGRSVHPVLPPGDAEFIPLAAPAADAGAGDAFKVVHRLLRGRYVLTIALAAGGALLGALVGYLAITPKFETRGIVSINPAIGKKIYDTEMQGAMQYLTSFVNKQAMLIKSARVLAKAAESPEWRALGRATGPRAEELLRRRVKAEPDPASNEVIFITSVDEDRNFTTTAVRAVVRAYASLHGDEGSIDAGLVKEVEEERNKLMRDIDVLESQVRAEAVRAGFGTEDLAQISAAKHMEVMGLQARVDDLELQLRLAGALGGEARVDGPNPADQPLTPMVIATMDPEMARLLARESDLEARIAQLRAEGYRERHPALISARGQLEGAKFAIKSRAEKFNAERKALVGGGAGGARSVGDMRRQHEGMQEHLTAKKQELARLDEFRAGLSKMTRELDWKRLDLTRVLDRLRVLTVEAADPQNTRGRIVITSEGDTPSVPTVDKRKIVAALGFMAGGGLPIGIMLLLGFMDRRFRFSDEAGELEAAPTLLGILPALPRDLDDPAQRAIAAHCVHQVRLLLQIGGAATGRKVYAITSPTPGDGKTSLALSLGLSFSAAGSRTLLIDFDMIGTGLTSNLRLENGHGLADVLRTGELNGSLLSLASDRLWVIPSRPEDDQYVNRLSGESVKRLIDQVRDEYDIILIDTGPVLGSLEASLVCAEADGVVMVVGRGQLRDHIENAFARVRDVGGRLIGMVFNRASPGDFRSSVSSTSVRSIPRALPAPEAGHRPGADRLDGAGPVVRTLALELDARAEQDER